MLRALSQSPLTKWKLLYFKLLSVNLANFWTAARRKWGARQHAQAVRSILDTPPIHPFDDGLILFSMIGTKVLLPYLVAVKSLQAQLGRGRAILLDDGTLTNADKAVLAAHVGNPVIISLSDIATSPCPRGNCWERLLAILDLRRAHYVIQLDADTVTLGPVPEVLQAITDNRSFTLGGGTEDAARGFMAVSDMIREIYPDGPRFPHIQHAIESALRDVPHAHALRYIRGCAGFAGFSRSDDGRAMAEGFAVDVSALVGARFHEWGSEQAASNFVIANDAEPLQLPYDRFTNHWAEALPDDPAFIHYIGTYRYDRGNYVASTKRAIAELQRKLTAA